MKNLAITLHLLFLVLIGFSQTPGPNFTYTYDNAGNRTKREYSSLKISGSSADTSKNYPQEIRNSKITVMPNPTQGNLAVRIENYDSEKKVTVMLFDEKGTLLKKMENAGGETRLNITDNPAGSYFLKVYIGTEKREWKIIKAD